MQLFFKVCVGGHQISDFEKCNYDLHRDSCAGNNMCMWPHMGVVTGLVVSSAVLAGTWGLEPGSSGSKLLSAAGIPKRGCSHQ